MLRRLPIGIVFLGISAFDLFVGELLWWIGRKHDPFATYPCGCWGPSENYVYFMSALLGVVLIPLSVWILYQTKTQTWPGRIIKITGLIFVAAAYFYLVLNIRYMWAIGGGSGFGGCPFACIKF